MMKLFFERLEADQRGEIFLDESEKYSFDDLKVHTQITVNNLD